MRLTTTVLAAATVGLAAAHGNGYHVPRFVGARKLLGNAKMFPRDLDFKQSGHQFFERAPGVPQNPGLDRRQVGGTSGMCGQGVGSCSTGYCCSGAGWCGNTPEYCNAPDCQISYGPGCDGNKKPSGSDTSSVSRKKLGNVDISGDGIYDCVNPGQIAITFDDGPYLYTNDLLDILKKYGARATFFITGNNLGKGMISDPNTIYPAILKRMANEGHQIASHTWSHQNASAITDAQYTNQIIYNEIAFNSVLGYFPTYMRPPYSICEANCQKILKKYGYHIIYFDLDTEGYLNTSPTLIQNSKNIWDAAINPANPATDNFLHIEHDIHYQTVYNLTEYTLKSLFAHGFQSVTVGECLGDPSANWYRAGPGGTVPTIATSLTQTQPTSTTTTKLTASTASTTSTVKPTTSAGSTGTTSSPPKSTSLAVSQSAQCGAAFQATCQGSAFGNCCSSAGWCGSTTAYCGTGCQAAYGSCESTVLGGVDQLLGGLAPNN